MAASDNATIILNKAKAALQHAKDFTKSVEGSETSQFAPKPVSKPAPKHEYSNAPYTLASEARDAGEGIKNRQKMAEAALKEPPH